LNPLVAIGFLAFDVAECLLWVLSLELAATPGIILEVILPGVKAVRLMAFDAVDECYLVVIACPGHLFISSFD
jgi:hypothetical protein